jgi:copper oxidase (laccase) domain-containing protein
LSENHPTVAVVPISVHESASRVDARFIGRIPGIGVTLERDAAMAALAPHQRRLLTEQGLGRYPLVTAQQIHGAEIAIVTEPSEKPIPGADGLLTMTRGITLGISVADCAPVWIVARDGSAGALLHSGKKGTESGIVPNGIQSLSSLSGTNPSDLIVVIGPCIRPPCYEVDFAAEIRRQAERSGVAEVYDEGICTACHPERYYSYRREQGLTGRMLATLTLLA